MTHRSAGFAKGRDIPGLSGFPAPAGWDLGEAEDIRLEGRRYPEVSLVSRCSRGWEFVLVLFSTNVCSIFRCRQASSRGSWDLWQVVAHGALRQRAHWLFWLDLELISVEGGISVGSRDFIRILPVSSFSLRTSCSSWMRFPSALGMGPVQEMEQGTRAWHEKNIYFRQCVGGQAYEKAG